jgi:hypothetical protein
MARSPVPIQIIGPAGDAVEGAEITLKDRDSGSASTHYSAESGGTSSSSVMTTDPLGETGRWATPGRYKIDISPPSPNPLGLGSRTDFPIDIAQGANITNSTTITHSISGSDLSFAINAGSVDGTHISTSAAPQIATLGLNVGPQSPHAISILSDSSSVKGLYVTNTAGGPSWFDFDSYVTATRLSDSLTFTGVRSNFHARVTAQGTRKVGTGWRGFRSQFVDRSTVVSVPITSISSAGLATTSSAHGFSAGERIAIHGTSLTGHNKFFQVAASPAPTATTFQLEQASGGEVVPASSSTGGTVTNAPFAYCFDATVAPQIDRSIDGSGTSGTNNVINADDLVCYFARNEGTARATDAFYIGLGGGVSGSEWITCFATDSPADFPFRIGAITIGADAALSAYGIPTGAGLDMASATLASGAHAIRLMNNGPIVGRLTGASYTFKHLISTGTSDQILFADDVANVNVWGAGANPVASNSGGRVLKLTGTNTATPELQFSAGGASSKADLWMYVRDASDVQRSALLQMDGSLPRLLFGTVTDDTVSFMQNNTVAFKLNVSGYLETSSGVRIGIGADPTHALTFETDTAASGGIQLSTGATPVNLFRSANNELRIGDSTTNTLNLNLTGAMTSSATVAASNVLYMSAHRSGEFNLARVGGTVFQMFNETAGNALSTVTQPTFKITAAGGVSWGVGGTTATDHTLSRTDAAYMSLTQGLNLGNALRLPGSGTNAVLWQANSTPSAPTMANGDARAYLKADKYIIHYKDGSGNNHYNYLDLDAGGTPAWAYSTTEP